MDNINRLKELTSDAREGDALVKAREDFRFVLGQANLTTTNYLDMQAIVKVNETLAYVLAVPFNTEDKSCVISGGKIRKEDPKMYVAAVCYRGGKPVDVFMFNSALFVKSNKIVKYNKKTDQYVIRIKNIKHKSMQQYAFGFVVRNL